MLIFGDNFFYFIFNNRTIERSCTQQRSIYFAVTHPFSFNNLVLNYVCIFQSYGLIENTFIHIHPYVNFFTYPTSAKFTKHTHMSISSLMSSVNYTNTWNMLFYKIRKFNSRLVIKNYIPRQLSPSSNVFFFFFVSNNLYWLKKFKYNQQGQC